MSRFLQLGKLGRGLLAALFAASLLGLSGNVQAGDVYISEIYFNLPEDPDADEFIELRGTASENLADHFLVFLENENGTSTTAGVVEAIFNLGVANNGSAGSLGTNGYALLLPKNRDNAITPALNTNVYTNAGTGTGYGIGNSTIGFTQETGRDGYIENSGFTALLFKNTSGSAPTLGQDLDSNNDNVIDYAGLGWTYKDSIGVIAEPDDVATGEVFSHVNFSVNDVNGNDLAAANRPASDSHWNTQQVLQGNRSEFNEIEYVARQGTEIANDRGSWIVANLKHNSGSLYEVASNPGKAVLGGASGSHWAQNFDVTNTYGSGNNTPEPASLTLAGLAALTMLSFRRRASC